MSLTLRALAPTLLLCAVLFPGCRMSTYIETPPAIAVEPVTHVLLLKTRSGGRLPRAEQQRLVDFLGVASGGRLDAIHVVVAGKHPAARRAVVRIARRIGVAGDNVRELEEVADHRFRFGVRVVAARYKAHAPSCPSLDIRGPVGNGNDFEPTLGCSTLANLAQTVNDPKDLLGNNAVTPTDGARATLAVRRHRSGGTADTTAGARSAGPASVASATGGDGE